MVLATHIPISGWFTVENIHKMWFLSPCLSAQCANDGNGSSSTKHKNTKLKEQIKINSENTLRLRFYWRAEWHFLLSRCCCIDFVHFVLLLPVFRFVVSQTYSLRVFYRNIFSNWLFFPISFYSLFSFSFSLLDFLLFIRFFLCITSVDVILFYLYCLQWGNATNNSKKNKYKNK